MYEIKETPVENQLLRLEVVANGRVLTSLYAEHNGSSQNPMYYIYQEETGVSGRTAVDTQSQTHVLSILRSHARRVKLNLERLSQADTTLIRR